jgi:hypothetical protein
MPRPSAGAEVRPLGPDVAGLPEPAGAVATIAAGVVLGLGLVVAVSNASSLPTRARWLLLLLALVAGILAMLRLWERYD